MSPDDLLSRFGESSKTVPPVGEQLELLVELCALYEDQGVVAGKRLPPLHLVCGDRSTCWAAIDSRRPPAGVGVFDPLSEKGCMILPWVGPQYHRGGVCVLGMNLRYQGADWEFAMEHRIARDPSGGQETSLRSGKRAHRSNWSAGTMRDAAAVLRSWRGESQLDTTNREELTNALLATARIQAVKCSPVGGRSSPEPAMNKNCPRRYLRRELDVLQPSVLLAYGASTHGALHELGTLAIQESGDGMRRGTMEHAGGAFEVVLLTHPAHGGWHKAHKTLIGSLERRPARSARQ